MSLNPSTVHSLRKVFQQGFIVHDITEPLLSFDDSSSAETVREFMKTNRFEVVGIRKSGRVEGFVDLADLRNGACGDYLKPFEDGLVISESESLAELVLQFEEKRRLFVSILGRVGGIVSRTDLQKPPVRMWLFGMVTLIEMRLSHMIERYCPDEQWRQYLSAGRIEKAEKLLAERTRRNQDLGLFDCLQMSDKTQIIACYEPLRRMTRYDSKRQLQEAAKMLEKLRNNLAHAQDIVTNDWHTIVALSERLDAVVDGPPGLTEAEA